MQLVDREAAASAEREAHLRAGISCLDRAIKLTPESWPALWIRGKAYQALDDHERAMDSFGTAYQLQPHHPDVGREYVVALLQNESFADAARVAGAVASAHPKDAGLRANFALTLLLNREVDRARSVIGEAVRMDPKDRVSRALQERIEEVARGDRPQPSSLEEMER